MPQGTNDNSNSSANQFAERRSLAASLYDNYNRWSGRPYVEGPPLEPLACAPLEPRIDELLAKVAETQDLQTLESLHLRISSSMICSQHLEVFLPNLKILDLTGSNLSSLRDLGTQLRIKSLNVSRCGLNGLDGTTGLSQLMELIADENSIRTVEQVCNLTDLRKLSLRANKIFSPDAVSFLFLCPTILELDLRDNPVAIMSDYREMVIDTMPTLRILDCEAIQEQPASLATLSSLSSSEYSSSTTSTSASTGSCGRSRSAISRAVSFASDSVAPIAGNIVAAVRGSRRSTGSSSPSLSSQSSTSMSSSNAAGGSGDGAGDGNDVVPLNIEL